MFSEREHNGVPSDLGNALTCNSSSLIITWSLSFCFSTQPFVTMFWVSYNQHFLQLWLLEQGKKTFIYKWHMQNSVSLVTWAKKVSKDENIYSFPDLYSSSLFLRQQHKEGSLVAPSNSTLKVKWKVKSAAKFSSACLLKSLGDYSFLLAISVPPFPRPIKQLWSFTSFEILYSKCTQCANGLHGLMEQIVA